MENNLKKHIVVVLVTQACLTLCNHMDCRPPGSSFYGLLQARTLEWVAISYSRGIFLTQGSYSGRLHCKQTLYHMSHQGSLKKNIDIDVSESVCDIPEMNTTL